MSGTGGSPPTPGPTGMRRDLTHASWRVRLHAAPLIGGPGDPSAGPRDPDYDAPVNLADRWFPATLPGCIHTDLMDAGVIPDPAIGDHEARVQLVSHADWRYECEFVLDAREAAWLAGSSASPAHVCFECLDTIASVELNGVTIGRAASEYVPWSFPTAGPQGDLLRIGPNTLAVTFASPVRHVRAEAARLGPRPVNGDWDPFVFVRKCASNFQWDWGPRVATVGIAGRVWLGDGPAAPQTGAGDPSTAVPPRWRATVDGPGALSFADACGPVFARGANWIPEGLWPRDRTPERVRARLEALRDAGLNMIRVWGGGRYEPDWFYAMCDELGLTVWQDFMFTCAMYPEEAPLAALVQQEARHQVGRLSTQRSVVLWCGGNECTWAHDDWGFGARLAPGQSWGRGYYLDMLPRAVRASDPRRAYWPNSPWSGEAAEPPVRPDDRGAASVPWRACNGHEAGDRHTWDVWGDGYRDAARVPRLCSEFGQQSPSNWATLREAGLLGAEGERPRDWSEAVACVRIGAGAPGPGEAGAFESDRLPPLLLARQRGPGDPQATPPVSPMERWYDRPMRAWFGPARSLFEWHFLAQVLQARSMQIGLEWFRANMDRCRGALVWQANDAWPGFSWSLIDSAGRRKLAWHAVRRACAARRLTIQPFDGEPTLVAISDADEPWTGEAVAARVALDGAVRRRGTVPFVVPPRSAVRVAQMASLVGPPDDACREALVVRTSRGPGEKGGPGDGCERQTLADRAWWFFVPDRELRDPSSQAESASAATPWRAHVEPTPEGWNVRVRAEAFCKDLCVVADAVGCERSSAEQMVTLLPGEEFVFAITGAQPRAARPG